MKTIKQIADELGIDKQRVYRFIKARQIKDVGEVESFNRITRYDTLYYDDAAQSLIKSHFETGTASSDTVFDAVLKHYETVIDALKNELETKNRQISDLTSALVTAQQTAVAAQALHAGTMKHIANEGVINEESKQGFFARIFKRNKGEI